MANLSQFINGGPLKQKPSEFDRPGSNGFWKRRLFRLPASYMWTADRDGFIKIQAIGAAAGGQADGPGASGSYGEKRLRATKGDALTIAVGAGGVGTANRGTQTGASGGSTSISGSLIGGTPLVLTGATSFPSGDPTLGTPGGFSGPWDVAFSGAAAAGLLRGSPSSASPYGVGRSGGSGSGGPGWGEDQTSGLGGSSIAIPGTRFELLDRFDPDFWDIANAENLGERVSSGFPPGIGAGSMTTSSSTPPMISPIGGGVARPGGSNAVSLRKSGHGAGGGSNAISSGTGGAGGDAIVFIFWDEGFE